MKSPPPVGTTSQKDFVVESRHTIDFADDQMPAVLCTPWLVWFLEHTARAAVLPFLESGESTVGTTVEIEHLAATPVGKNVSCLARVVHVEGQRVSFHIEARDHQELIARGHHKLQIIEVQRFARRVKQKT
jgi:fluoroacetyl-CoA thioesterase